MILIDIEVYTNYLLVCMMDAQTGKIRTFERFNDEGFEPDRLNALLCKYTTGSFNGFGYDLPLLTYAIDGASNAQIKALSDRIIKGQAPVRRVMREAGIDIPKRWDHIDIIDVAPGQSSLKIYGGRLHAKRLQDLPIDPSAKIDEASRQELIRYCRNDLELTRGLFESLSEQARLRVAMSKQYGLDLRSKSDAQIAESVILSELKAITGDTYRSPELDEAYGFRYRDPGFLEFQTPTLKDVYRRILSQRFTLGANGAVIMPEWLRESPIEFCGARYQLGIGGIHSCEKSQFVRAEPGWIIEDRDVASYYPNIILQQQLYPQQLGREFVRVYQSIVTRRMQAKRAGDTVVADTLKICVNGSFGKLGSKYSALYSPDLLIQVTVTGQLALLMLIESLCAIGVRVLSANTDGIVLHYPDGLASDVEAVCFDWTLRTSYELEATRYQAIASRDVNNYVAVKTNGKTKGKGCFAPAGLRKNPDGLIVYEAVAQQIAQGRDYRETIRSCRDIRQFVSLRRVQGGAKWRDQLLGKTVRFYISSSVPQSECIHYATNSNRVPKSAGARPLMDLADEFPADVDYQYYEVEAEKLLCEVGWRHA